MTSLNLQFKVAEDPVCVPNWKAEIFLRGEASLDGQLQSAALRLVPPREAQLACALNGDFIVVGR